MYWELSRSSLQPNFAGVTPKETFRAGSATGGGGAEAPKGGPGPCPRGIGKAGGTSLTSMPISCAFRALSMRASSHGGLLKAGTGGGATGRAIGCCGLVWALSVSFSALVTPLVLPFEGPRERDRRLPLRPSWVSLRAEVPLALKFGCDPATSDFEAGAGVEPPAAEDCPP